MSSFKAILMGAAAAGALATSAAAMPMNDVGLQAVTVQKAAVVCNERPLHRDTAARASLLPRLRS
jgi:hypothetical protein